MESPSGQTKVIERNSFKGHGKTATNSMSLGLFKNIDRCLLDSPKVLCFGKSNMVAAYIWRAGAT